MDYRQERRIVKQWVKGERLAVLCAQHGLDLNTFAALIRRVGEREPGLLLPILTEQWGELREA